MFIRNLVIIIRSVPAQNEHFKCFMFLADAATPSLLFSNDPFCEGLF